ncbi:hypothetical protein E1A91_D02G194500v1 [Gossypium mustelinum]|uniref:Uncharacterized protein n=1 Tax=Gossypium mustelinum TaxID=34275 RepID=A0A5D2VY73_GOSMU|nr:hypothetical protein E1A91_D02G194500v1 [Gossypium mustelinum]
MYIYGCLPERKLVLLKIKKLLVAVPPMFLRISLTRRLIFSLMISIILYGNSSLMQVIEVQVLIIAHWVMMMETTNSRCFRFY